MTEAIHFIVPLVGLLVIVAGAMQAVSGRFRVAVGTFVSGAFMIGALALLPTLIKTLTTTLEAESEDAGAASSEADDGKHSGTADVDWSWLTRPATLITVASVVVLAACVAAAVYLIRRRRTAETEADAEVERLDRVWSESVERHDRVRDAWMAYQSDIGEILAKPTLSDLNDPHVVRLVEALGFAADLANDVRPPNAPAVERYARATRAAEQAWRRASAHAERVRLARFSDGEQDRIRRAERLLAQARSGAASPSERRTYYQRAMKLLDGLIQLPEPAREAIETVARGELESATLHAPATDSEGDSWVFDRSSARSR